MFDEIIFHLCNVVVMQITQKLFEPVGCLSGSPGTDVGEVTVDGRSNAEPAELRVSSSMTKVTPQRLRRLNLSGRGLKHSPPVRDLYCRPG